MRYIANIVVFLFSCCTCPAQVRQLRFDVYTTSQLDKAAQNDTMLRYALAETGNVPDTLVRLLGCYFWSGLHPGDTIVMEDFWNSSCSFTGVQEAMKAWLNVKKYKRVKLYSQHTAFIAGTPDVEPEAERMGYEGYKAELLRWSKARASYGETVAETALHYRGYRKDKNSGLLVVPLFYNGLYLCDLLLMW